MALLSYFRGKEEKPKSANRAKERLQIIVAHERSRRGGGPDYLPQLKKDILKVIAKYVTIDDNQVSVQLDQKDEDLAVLELEIQLPDERTRMEITHQR